MKKFFLLYSICTVVNSFAPSVPTQRMQSLDRSGNRVLYGKKKKKAGGGGGGKPRGGQQQQEKQSVKDARFDAATRQFMYSLVGLTKILPDKSKKILDNINLSFTQERK